MRPRRFAVLLPMALAGATVVLAACKHEQYVGGVVERYCKSSPESRALLRQQVNDDIAPHRIEVTCAGDEEGFERVE
ncbi:MAG: hypothetical protein GWO02_05135 [Gammaproteobacteria bacterium]|nr:hypothetical protein [Gammaproteobacteria bacterium]